VIFETLNIGNIGLVTDELERAIKLVEADNNEAFD
jgi:hypothetical protein